MGLGRVARVALLLALTAACAPAHPPPATAVMPRPRLFGVAVETGKTAHGPRRQGRVRPLRSPAGGRPSGSPVAGGRPRPRVRPEQGPSLDHVAFPRREGRRRSRREPRQPPRWRECPAGERREHARPRRVAEGPLRDRGDPLFGLVDPERIALAGHSAGGAVAFEAAAGGTAGASRRPPRRRPVAADDPAAREMPVTRLLSLRSEPSACNAQGSVRKLLANLRFESDDVRIVGGTHCDAEDPTDGVCRLFCGGTSDEARAAYRRLLYLVRCGTPSTRPRSGRAGHAGPRRSAAASRTGRSSSSGSSREAEGRQNPTRVVRTPPYAPSFER